MIEDVVSTSKDLVLPTKISWKQMLIGKGDHNQGERPQSAGKDNEGEIEFLEYGVKKTIVNGISAIEFSKCIQQILLKNMETTVVLKFLGKNIGYIALFNQISNLWRPSRPFNLMDIEMIVYGQYLTVQLWTMYFNPMKPYPSMVLAWIRLPGLPGFMYKRRILEAIGGLVGNVVKLDLNTDSKTRCRFSRMDVFVDLNKALISQVMVMENCKVSSVNVEGTEPNGFNNETDGSVELVIDNLSQVLGEKDPYFVVNDTGINAFLVNPKSWATKVNNDGLEKENSVDLGLRAVWQIAKDLETRGQSTETELNENIFGASKQLDFSSRDS
ncbi:hypothetical protein Gogos_010355, partial [Gossypium gossypioides]|nr:hypothetical protein [Gossypium gossypioides]